MWEKETGAWHVVNSRAKGVSICHYNFSVLLWNVPDLGDLGGQAQLRQGLAADINLADRSLSGL